MPKLMPKAPPAPPKPKIAVLLTGAELSDEWLGLMADLGIRAATQDRRFLELNTEMTRRCNLQRAAAGLPPRNPEVFRR